ncbi:MAG TPA: hypothetical protein PKH95_02220 [Candidatus Magasanikbacteria bacterium]|nr:hypothetical protein [Candidatus Magasanikbacteria bacterium]
MFNSVINGMIGEYFPIIIVVETILVIFLVYLQFKGEKKKKKEKQPESKKEEKREDTIFSSQTQEKIELKKIPEPKKIMDPKTLRIYSHIMSEIRNLTTDGQELGFDYTSDYIQILIADIPKAIEHYLNNFGTFTKGTIPVIPCIPENLVPPNQLIATAFMGGKCSVPLGRIKNTAEIPKKPYWLFDVEIKRISLEKIFLTEEIGLTVNEIIRVAVIKDEIWRNTGNYIVGTGSLLDDVSPIIFRYNHSGDHPEIVTHSEKDKARDYYLAYCKDRRSF